MFYFPNRKLNEVKDRLSQLKSLVHLYESTEGAAGNVEQMDNDDQTSVPAYSDYGAEAEVSRDRGYITSLSYNV